MRRRLEPEWLDELPAADPRAVRSRRDLGRINALMGHASFVAGALRQLFPTQAPRRIVELGCGDGLFAWRVARRVAGIWPGVEVIGVDQAPCVAAPTRERFQDLGWSFKFVEADIFDWLGRNETGPIDAVVANLFLHHFPEPELRQMFAAVASRGSAMVACEPRRSLWALGASRLLGLIGCNDVTRHDAVISVRAGFAAEELSRFWPGEPGWELSERPHGSFSHLFVARPAGAVSRERRRPQALRTTHE